MMDVELKNIRINRKEGRKEGNGRKKERKEGKETKKGRKEEKKLLANLEIHDSPRMYLSRLSGDGYSRHCRYKDEKMGGDRQVNGVIAKLTRTTQESE